MALNDVVKAITDEYGKTAIAAAKAYEEIVTHTEALEKNPPTPGADTALIAAMSRLWLSNVRMAAISARAPGKVVAEIAQLDQNKP